MRPSNARTAGAAVAGGNPVRSWLPGNHIPTEYGAGAGQGRWGGPKAKLARLDVA
jgi:hypothetical protein